MEALGTDFFFFLFLSQGVIFRLRSSCLLDIGVCMVSVICSVCPILLDAKENLEMLSHWNLIPMLDQLCDTLRVCKVIHVSCLAFAGKWMWRSVTICS